MKMWISTLFEIIIKKFVTFKYVQKIVQFYIEKVMLLIYIKTSNAKNETGFIFWLFDCKKVQNLSFWYFHWFTGDSAYLLLDFQNIMHKNADFNYIFD